MKRLLLILFVFLFHSTCFGQSLAAYSGDKMIGWLQSREVNSDSWYVTTDGYLLYLRSDGIVKLVVNEIFFDDENCKINPRAPQKYYGMIARFGESDAPGTQFVRFEHILNFTLEPAPYVNDNGCAAYGTPRTAVSVEFIDPADYGIQYIDGQWKVSIDSIIVDRPDNIFCNGYESCPTENLCGNNVIDTGEQCDDGAFDTETCDSDCTVAQCGDGFVNQQALEECDDGNQDNNDACLNSCQPAVCGDGVVRIGLEECDDGNDNNDDACDNSCKLPLDPCDPNPCPDGYACTPSGPEEFSCDLI